MENKKVRGPKPKTYCKNGHEFTDENSIQMYHSNGSKNGRKCRTCTNEKQKVAYDANPDYWKSRSQNYRKVDPTRRKRQVRENYLLTTYGITHAQYESMLSLQNGVCAICKTDNPKGSGRKAGHFCIDHCHTTGNIRQLLCGECNSGIGKLQDNPEIVLAAYNYLTLHKHKQQSLTKPL